MTHRHIFTNATLATLNTQDGYGIIPDGVIITHGEHVAYAGPIDKTPDFDHANATDLEGRLVTPGLIDCHTHAAFAGSRAQEFEMRLKGVSYEEIARSGGGIMSTVTATREATEEELLADTLARIDRFMASGVTTIEIKSGYGLDEDNELKLLRVAREVETHRNITVRTTYLGAHAVPKGVDADSYIDEVCIPVMHKAHQEGLIDAVDGFCENIGFSPAQIQRVFEEATYLNLPVKLHAEQLSDQGGAKLTAHYNGLSADHLEYISEDGVIAMKEAGTVAVILPGAFYFLRETQKPPIELFRKHNVPMAVSTDCNPGTSPMTSLPLAMNMAATLFAMTPEECLRGVTVNAAKALGLSDRGQIKTGLRADLAIWDVNHPAALTYQMGDAPLFKRIFGGQIC